MYPQRLLKLPVNVIALEVRILYVNPVAEGCRYGASEQIAVYLKILHSKALAETAGIVPERLLLLTPIFSSFGQSARVSGSEPENWLSDTNRCGIALLRPDHP